jgi:hypothetical protein
MVREGRFAVKTDVRRRGRCTEGLECGSGLQGAFGGLASRSKPRGLYLVDLGFEGLIFLKLNPFMME